MYNKSHASVDIVKYLVKAGADIDAYADAGWPYTPIGLAVKSSNIAAMKALIKLGADIEKPNGRDHSSALLLACNNGLTQAAEVLLKAGADINARDAYGYTPIFLASENEKGRLVAMLLDAGADITERFDRAGGYSAWSNVSGWENQKEFYKVIGFIQKKIEEEEAERADEFEAHYAAMRKWRRTTDFDDPNRPEPPKRPHTKWGDLLASLDYMP